MAPLKMLRASPIRGSSPDWGFFRLGCFFRARVVGGAIIILGVSSLPFSSTFGRGVSRLVSSEYVVCCRLNVSSGSSPAEVPS